VNINSFAKKTDLDEASKYLVPIGAIFIWSGTIATIPVGWVLCDGTKGTPDLRDKFVMGAGDTVSNTYAVGSYGGSADTVLPLHTHVLNDPGHKHISPYSEAFTGPFGNVPGINGKQGSAKTDYDNTWYYTSSEITDITIDSAGSGNGTGANLPPYYALAFIMKIKN
jgi:microcystin-dependent protein